MCEYCGCRDEPTISGLTDEHDALLDVAYELYRTASRRTHGDVMAVIRTHLSPLLTLHTRKEERGLFVEMQAVWADDPRLTELTSEHRDIEALLDVVSAGGDSWRPALKSVVHLLDDHIEAEETDLFPAANQELSTSQWEAIVGLHTTLDRAFAVGRSGATGPPRADGCHDATGKVRTGRPG